MFFNIELCLVCVFDRLNLCSFVITTLRVVYDVLVTASYKIGLCDATVGCCVYELVTHVDFMSHTLIMVYSVNVSHVK